MGAHNHHREIIDIVETATDIGSLLTHAKMKYASALAVKGSLVMITKAAHTASEAHNAECARLAEIIEGLVANWPEVEVGMQYSQACNNSKPRAVFLKKEALERALEVIKSMGAK